MFRRHRARREGPGPIQADAHPGALAEANRLIYEGGPLYRAGRFTGALDLTKRALRLFREAGDRAGEADTLSKLAVLSRHVGKTADALDYLEQAAPLLHEVGNRRGEAGALNNVAWLYIGLGRRTEALGCLERALPLFRELGDRRGEAAALDNLGALHRDMGQPRKAVEYYEQAVPKLREVDEHDAAAAALDALSALYRSLSRMPRGSDERAADESTVTSKVFLAHAYRDREIVQRIADDLAAGWDVETVVDNATLFLGDSLLERVASTIGSRGNVAVALSPRSVGADWVQEEVRSLVSRDEGDGIIILPLLVADCELPDFLEDRFFADFRRPESFRESLDLIVRRLGLPDTFRGLKEIGGAWNGPISFKPTELLELSLVFFDGAEAVVGSHPRIPTALHVPADTRLAKLPLLTMARTLSLDFHDGGYRLVHLESKSSLRPQRSLSSEGVASGDHLVIAVGRGASMDAEAIVRHARSVVQNHDR